MLQLAALRVKTHRPHFAALHLVAIGVLVLSTWASSMLYGGDNVRAAAPVEITNCTELENISLDLAGDYVLANDIDCAPSDGAVHYSEDFEGGGAGWVSSGTNDTWSLLDETCDREDVAAAPFNFDSTVHGSNGKAGPDCLGGNEETSTLTSPAIGLPVVSNLYLRFDSWAYDQGGKCTDDSADDTKDVALVVNGGPAQILNDCYALHPNSAAQDELGAHTWWFDLSAYAGETIELSFHYQTQDNDLGFELGWFIDNVAITETDFFEPIGTTGDSFDGTLDGDDHTISNLLIEETGDYVGLFGYTGATAEIKNVGLTSGNLFTTGSYAGGLVGFNAGTLENVYANLDVRGANNIGGLVGSSSGEISQASAGGEVIGEDFVGGLVGEVNGSVSYSSATGQVSLPGNCCAGGLIGALYGTVDNSYARGKVSSDGLSGNQGGLVGVSTGMLTNSYATGVVTGTLPLGGLIATDVGSVVNSFWDMETSGLTTSAGGEGKSTADMLDVATYTTDLASAAWDFDMIWRIDPLFNDGYPYLWWQAVEPDPELHRYGFTNPITGNYVVLEADVGCEIISATMTPETSNQLKDVAFDYPHGLMNFVIDCRTPGYTTTITQYHYDVVGEYNLRKYDPNIPAYFTVSDSTLTATTNSGQPVLVVVHQVTDGGELDIDSISDGIITDPIGLAVNVVGVPNTGLGGGR